MTMREKDGLANGKGKKILPWKSMNDQKTEVGSRNKKKEGPGFQNFVGEGRKEEGGPRQYSRL